MLTVLGSAIFYLIRK